MSERVRAFMYVMGVTLVISVLVWQLTGRVVLPMFLLLTVTFVMAMVYWAVTLMKANAED